MLSYLIVSPEDQVGAGMAMVTLQGEFLGREWNFGVDGNSAAISQRELAMQAIIASGNSEQMQGEGLATFVLKATDPASSLLIFAPPRKGDWIKNVLAMAQKMPVSVMICAKSVSDSGFLSACKDVLFLSEEIEITAIVSHEDLREVISSFDGSGVQLSIVLQDSKTIVSAEH